MQTTSLASWYSTHWETTGKLGRNYRGGGGGGGGGRGAHLKYLLYCAEGEINKCVPEFYAKMEVVSEKISFEILTMDRQNDR